MPVSFRAVQPCGRCQHPLRLCAFYRQTIASEVARLNELEQFAQARGPDVEVVLDCHGFTPRTRKGKG